MSDQRGKIIIIVAPSGTGKSTLIKKLLDEFKELYWSTSFTTRPKRDGEVHGDHYFFITKDEFLNKKDNNEFVEWAEVHGNYYGTGKDFVEKKLARGEFVIFDLDVQGVDNMKDAFGDEAKAIFIAPPSLEILRERLLARRTDPQSVIELRVENAKMELSRKNDFDFLIVNDDLEKADFQLKQIVRDILEES